MNRNNDSQEEMSYETHMCVMTLQKKDVEYTEFNLAQNIQNDTTTTILTTHIPMKELQRDYYTVLKYDNKGSRSYTCDNATRADYSW